MYQIKWTEYSKDDYEKLDGSQRVFVDKALNRIKLRGMSSGQPLRGNLTGCNRLKNNRLGLRIIFREVQDEDEDEVEVIQIVVIGKRSNKDVYNTAVIRLK